MSMPNELPEGIDKDVKELVVAMNARKGIVTTCSCAGHGENPPTVFFVPETDDALLRLLYDIAACHSGQGGWRVEVYTDCAMDGLRFVLTNKEIGADCFALAIALEAAQVAEASRKTREEVS